MVSFKSKSKYTNKVIYFIVSIRICEILFIFIVSKKGKIYIIYYTWQNTAKNHAGMAHFVKKLKSSHPREIKLIKIPSNINAWHSKLQKLYFYFIVFSLKISLNKEDKILFMEFLGNRSGNQTGIALKLRALGVINEFFGLVHLSPDNLLELYGSAEYIKKSLVELNKIIVFGSSLAGFFSDLGFKDKVIRTLHYVDNNFYNPSAQKVPNADLQVIHMGSIKRDFHKLKEIVKQCSNAHFHICQGTKDLTKLFSSLKNVTLYGYLEEKELLSLMQNCDVSLSILHDTVGSNVITTSMACGLVNVVSDVGSIRDYCDDTSSMLCRTNEEFVNSINLLNKKRDIYLEKRNASLKSVDNLSLDKSISKFYDILFEKK